MLLNNLREESSSLHAFVTYESIRWTLNPQPVITKDNVEIQVDGLIWVRHGLEAEDIQKTYFIN